MLRLDHVQLAIPAGSEERCDTFYVDLLGLEPLEKPAPLAGRGGRWYQVGACQVHLGVDPAFVPATKAHPALVVEDLDALLVRCAAAGVVFTPDTSMPERRRGFVVDPVGNRVELIAATR